MKHLKKFNEAINSDIKWSFHLESTVDNKYSFSEEDLKEALNAPNDPFILDFYGRIDDDIEKEYTGNSNVSFQTSKKNEISKLWMDNLVLDYSESSIKLSVDFKITFPDDWDKGYVIEWCEGFHRITTEWFFLQSEKTANGNRMDRKLYNEYRDFFKQIEINQKFKISKV